MKTYNSMSQTNDEHELKRLKSLNNSALQRLKKRRFEELSRQCEELLNKRVINLANILENCIDKNKLNKI